MQNQDLVSIITPSWNCGKFVEETIKSIQAQTYKNWELLFQDDCSTDNTKEIVAKMDVSIAVISSPTRVAPSLVLPIINAGIKGVLNFTSAPLNFPNGIVAENYDITTILEKVAYFVKESDEKQ